MSSTFSPRQHPNAEGRKKTKDPFLLAAGRARRLAQHIKDAPAAQYAVRVAALSVVAGNSPPPPPSVPRPVHLGTSEDPNKDDDDGIIYDNTVATSITVTVAEAEAEAEAQTPPKHRRPRIVGHMLDTIVSLAGSRYTFALTLVLIAAWAIVGIVEGPSPTWQVVIQDTSSIQCYMSDTLLMRQQQNSTRSLLSHICTMISRSESNERMLRLFAPEQLARRRHLHAGGDLPSTLAAATTITTKESLVDKTANAVSAALGSLVAIALYWGGILAWLVLGIPLGFSNTWQLYINTATALELTLTSMFLQAVRRQHDEYLDRCLRAIDDIDRETETHLRRATGASHANPAVSSSPPCLTRVERCLDAYAFIIGGAIGVAVSLAVLVVWLAAGPPMAFDDNWWLIIGTYTGLVGFVDGFVLRNVAVRESALADTHFDRLRAHDTRLFALLGAAMPDTTTSHPHHRLGLSLSARVSTVIGRACSASWASVGSVVAVVALLATASGMAWTETGQLLCNTPTMIVEGFLLLMLIEAHNGADARRRAQWADVLARRVALLERVVCLCSSSPVSSGGGGDDDGDYSHEGGLIQTVDMDKTSTSTTVLSEKQFVTLEAGETQICRSAIA